MPPELSELQERTASADGTPRREAIRARLAAHLPLYRLSRYRPPRTPTPTPPSRPARRDPTETPGHHGAGAAQLAPRSDHGPSAPASADATEIDLPDVVLGRRRHSRTGRPRRPSRPLRRGTARTNHQRQLPGDHGHDVPLDASLPRHARRSPGRSGTGARVVRANARRGRPLCAQLALGRRAARGPPVPQRIISGSAATPAALRDAEQAAWPEARHGARDASAASAHSTPRRDTSRVTPCPTHLSARHSSEPRCCTRASPTRAIARRSRGDWASLKTRCSPYSIWRARASSHPASSARYCSCRPEGRRR